MRDSATDARDRLSAWIAADAELAPGEIIAGGIVIFRTERMLDDGTVVHRQGVAYPFGGISDTEEIGLIEQARRSALS